MTTYSQSVLDSMTEEISAAAEAGLSLGEELPANIVWAFNYLIERKGYSLDWLMSEENDSKVYQLLTDAIDTAHSDFFGEVDTNNGSEQAVKRIIELAHDKTKPAFLRNQAKKILDEAVYQTLPDLKPNAYDYDKGPMYTTADLAEALGIPEKQVITKAQEIGALDINDPFYRIDNQTGTTTH